jgi:hypothetical protein
MWEKLDQESSTLECSRNHLVRQILRKHFSENDSFLIQETLDDIVHRTDQIREYVNPDTENGYREAARILRGIRYNAERVEEEVLG